MKLAYFLTVLLSTSALTAHQEENVLLQAVSQGLSEVFESASVCSPLPYAEVQERGQNMLYAWGVDYICSNGIIEKDKNRIPTDEEIKSTVEFFSERNLPFIWWTSAKKLESKGFQFGGTLTGIALDISQGLPPKSEVSSKLKIRVVQSESDLRIFNQLVADVFEMSPKAAEQCLLLNGALMREGEQIHYLAYLGDVPVGTASLSTCNSSAGIWNLVTLPEYRKLGIGGALVHTALIEAKKQQYGQVMAVLMPERLAWGLFAKLGFSAVSEFPFYVYGTSAEGLEK